jgi:hypothetical protein
VVAVAVVVVVVDVMVVADELAIDQNRPDRNHEFFLFSAQAFTSSGKISLEHTNFYTTCTTDDLRYKKNRD